MDIDIRTSGPIFSAARTTAAVRRFERDVVHDVTAQGRANVMLLLDRSIRNPTPYYETQIRVRYVANDQALVHDSDVVYGPWLEGTGSRNSPVTSFAGYAAFRRARDLTDRQVPQLARPALDRLARELG